MTTSTDIIVLVRGGGDLATGVISRLHHSGFPVIVTELETPLAVRRTVSVASAVFEGNLQIEDMEVQLVDSAKEAIEKSHVGLISVMISPGLPDVNPSVVIDARLAKKNIDTQISDADLVIGMGPGFIAGEDCHRVIETKRGHSMGRVIRTGSALEDTGIPESVAGHGANRVLRSPKDGQIIWNVEIGDQIKENQVIGSIEETEILGPFAGIIRGLIHPSVTVKKKMKIGDVDPRISDDWNQISDKALAVGGGVLEAILSWQQ
ncbi:MAG: selenium-dependent molybdenum cofactor biosynthesis protein YqeB [Actinomycetota bacterium]